MSNVELKGAPSGAPFLLTGGLEEMPTKIGVLYELSRDVASSHTVQNLILSCGDALVNPREAA